MISGVEPHPARLGVLHVAQPTDGGVGGYVAAAAADQAERGWRVTVACHDRGRLAESLDAAGIARVPWSAGRSPGPGVVAEAWRLRGLVASLRPDVVHLHSAKAGLAGRLALTGRVPTLFQPHGWSWLAVTGAVAAASLRWERCAARWTDTCVCVGEGEVAQAREVGVGGRHVVVRNGVDLSRYRPADDAARRAARAGLGVPLDIPLVVCPGRLTRQKGQDVLLRAWPAVRAGCPDAQLAVVGGGDLGPELAGALGPGVRLVGPVSDVRPWLTAADVVAFPSRWEGLSLGLLEAMAVGRSTVVSAIPGLAEVVDDTVGAAVPADAADPLAAALVERLRDPARTRAEGATAAARAAAQFGSRATYERLAAVTVDAGGRRRHR